MQVSAPASRSSSSCTVCWSMVPAGTRTSNADSRCRRQGPGHSTCRSALAAETTMAGRSALAQPISWAGWSCRSRSSTTASSGWPRIISSVSIAARLRYSMLVRLRKTSLARWSETPAADRRPARRRLDRLGHGPQVLVTVVDLAPGVTDPDGRLAQIGVGVALPLLKGVADEGGKAGVAVTGQLAFGLLVAHRALLTHRPAWAGQPVKGDYAAAPSQTAAGSWRSSPGRPSRPADRGAATARQISSTSSGSVARPASG